MPKTPLKTSDFEQTLKRPYHSENSSKKYFLSFLTFVPLKATDSQSFGMVCTGPFGAEHQNTLLGTPEAHHHWAFRTYFSPENGHPPSEHGLKNRNS